ncbi:MULTISPECIES: hypothetical protein [unclassified Streptomyces]|uniref:hypothetical protein n=1 Tax=unclassified Streptomyces TaxID=2593676 RepID=UPI00081E01A9|nr:MULTISPECIES: hypothetical protein [unclassified Streptomyces]MYZ38432.1 hypothetical protein [Streptomyces sp. SID4917]SCF98440.1 hypothetical protein GA0115259_106344 [Streptomyces sp. MnatMP-M17]
MPACDWTLDTSCCPGWADYSPAVQAAATAWAMGILDSLTGHQFGQCPVTVRPCGPKCQGYGGYMTWPVGWPGASGSGMPWMLPYIDGAGAWRNCLCGKGGCSCRARCEVPIPGPATVTEVRVDGIVLDPSAYRLDNGHLLVRTDGECWPDCQDMNVGITEAGSFAVTLSPGLPLPPAGAIAAGELACEFAKACSGDASCALPQQLQSLSRQGINVQVVDPQAITGDGLTGIANVDLWIRSVNPTSKRQRSRVHSPDVTPVRYV